MLNFLTGTSKLCLLLSSAFLRFSFAHFNGFSSFHPSSSLDVGDTRSLTYDSEFSKVFIPIFDGIFRVSNLGEQDITSIQRKEAKSDSLLSLEIENIDESYSNTQYIFHIFSVFRKEIVHFDMHNCQLDLKCFASILHSLLGNSSSIQWLSLINCNINEAVLVEYISTTPIPKIREDITTHSFNSKLYLLDLSNNNLDSKSFKILSSIINTLHQLTTIIFDGNKFTSEDIRSFIHSIKRHPSIKSLSFASCNLDDECIKFWNFYLKSNRNIFHLDLSNNKITSKGIFELISSFEGAGVAKRLESLDLSYNQIDDEGLAIISKAIRSNWIPNLKHLKLKQISASPDAFQKFLCSFPSNTSIEVIDISGNDLFLSTNKCRVSITSIKGQKKLLRKVSTDALLMVKKHLNQKTLQTGISKSWETINTMISSTGISNTKNVRLPRTVTKSRKSKTINKSRPKLIKKSQKSKSKGPKLLTRHHKMKRTVIIPVVVLSLPQRNVRMCKALRQFISNSNSLKELHAAKINLDDKICDDIFSEVKNTDTDTISKSTSTKNSITPKKSQSQDQTRRNANINILLGLNELSPQHVLSMKKFLLE